MVLHTGWSLTNLKQGVRTVNKILIALLTSIVFSLTLAANLIAAEGWEANITVRSGTAKNILYLGQQPDATDRKDSRYDGKALLGGTLQAWFENDGADLWRDIRGTENDSEWWLKVNCQTNLPIDISWDQATFPDGITIEMTDTANGNVIDMKSTSGYTLNKVSEAELIINIKSK